jgi:cation diffusion facilitator family transporter
MQNDKKVKVALNSVFWSMFLTLMKGVVGLITGSLGILSEALHSALDLGAALLTFFSVRVADKPADKKHPYGHSKIESVSALIESALLFVTSGWIIYEAIKRLFFKEVEVEIVWYAFVVIIISIFVDISRSRALMKVAKETKSQALEADALHFSSDIWSSGAVLVGLICAYFKIPMADTVAALVVAIVVLHAGYKLSKRTFDVLIDTAPVGIAEIVEDETRKVEGVIGISKIRVRPAGATIFIEVGIEVSRKISLERAKEIGKKVEEKIKLKIGDGDITVNTTPVVLNNETMIENIQILAHLHNVSVHDITIHLIDNKKYINFDLEVEASLSLSKAHEIATKLEESIKKEFGDDVEINTHIEPLRSNILEGKKVDKTEQEKIISEIKNVANDFKNIYEIHDIDIRKINEKIFISLHAYSQGDTLLEKAHDEAGDLEYLIKQKIKNVARVVVHLEPKEE